MSATSNKWLIRVAGDSETKPFFASPRDALLVEAALQGMPFTIAKSSGEYCLIIPRVFGRTFLYASEITWPDGTFWSYATGFVPPSKTSPSE